MNPIFQSALALQEFCDNHSWPSCFIGGIAVQRWGEPRMTRDVDLTLLTGFGDELKFIDPLLLQFHARLPGAREFAVQNRVLLLKDSLGTPLDIALGALPFEENTIQRASLWEIGNGSLRTCSAEDLIVHKAFAGRDQDWLDIKGILIRQSHQLDFSIINEELPPLLALKNAEENLVKLHNLIRDLNSAS